MSNTKFILGEIRKWREEELISPEQETALRARYTAGTESHPLRYVLAFVGVAFIIAGGSVLFTAMGLTVPESLKKILVFLPLIASDVTAIAVVLKGKRSPALNECCAFFCTAGVFATCALADFVFDLPADGKRYLLACGLVLLPVFAVFRAVLSPAVYFTAVILWGRAAIGGRGLYADNLIAVAVMLIAVGAGAAVEMLSSKGQSTVLTAAARWISAAAIIISCGFSANMLNVQTGAVLLLLFCIMMLLGRDDLVSSPFTSAGTAGTFVMLILTMSGATEIDARQKNLLTYAVITVLSAAAFLLWLLRERKNVKKTVLTAAALVCVAVTLAASDRYSLSHGAELRFALPLAGAILAAGVTYITFGIRDNSFACLNAGLITVTAFLGYSFSASDIPATAKGLFIFLLGAVFLTVNIIFSVRAKKKKQTEATRENK